MAIPFKHIDKYESMEKVFDQNIITYPHRRGIRLFLHGVSDLSLSLLLYSEQVVWVHALPCRHSRHDTGSDNSRTISTYPLGGDTFCFTRCF